MRESVEPHSLFSRRHERGLWRLLRFETASLIGRLFQNGSAPIRNDRPNLLNICCGRNYAEGFINADYFIKWKPWKKQYPAPDWKLDARYPFNCPSKVMHGVFSEHTLEHFYPRHALFFLRELHRIMLPGARLRITVPDLRKYVDYYLGAESAEEFGKWPTGCEAIRSLTQNWDHLSVWDETLLRRFLSEAGFSHIEKCAFGLGGDDRLLLDKPSRTWATLYIEATKS